MKHWSERIGTCLLAACAALLAPAVPASAQGLAAGEYKVGFITENTGVSCTESKDASTKLG